MAQNAPYKSMSFPFKIKQVNIQFFYSFLKTQILNCTFLRFIYFLLPPKFSFILLVNRDLQNKFTKNKIVLLIIVTHTFSFLL